LRKFHKTYLELSNSLLFMMKIVYYKRFMAEIDRKFFSLLTEFGHLRLTFTGRWTKEWVIDRVCDVGAEMMCGENRPRLVTGMTPALVNWYHPTDCTGKMHR